MADLAFRCPDERGAVARIRRDGHLIVQGRPHHLDVGGTVAVVQHGGIVALTFKCRRIEGPLSVRGPQQYRLIAQRETFRLRPVEKRLPIRWYAVGQFRYFDSVTWRPLNLSGEWGEGPHLVDGAPSDPSEDVRLYAAGIPGRRRDDPESRLVDAYVAWMRDEDRFEHHRMDEADGYTDLFDRRYWRVIEAKAQIDRRTLRLAVGQLMDYKHRYRRTPSIGVLLPARPDRADLDYLDWCRVAAIWQTPAGNFSDNRDREWT